MVLKVVFILPPGSPPTSHSPFLLTHGGVFSIRFHSFVFAWICFPRKKSHSFVTFTKLFWLLLFNVYRTKPFFPSFSAHVITFVFYFLGI